MRRRVSVRSHKVAKSESEIASETLRVSSLELMRRLCYILFPVWMSFSKDKSFCHKMCGDNMIRPEWKG